LDTVKKNSGEVLRELVKANSTLVYPQPNLLLISCLLPLRAQENGRGP
jgi:hypothetical protein